MSSTPLMAEIERLSENERRNLATILDLDERSSPEEICEKVRWMYRSRAREKLTRPIRQTWKALKYKPRKAEPDGTRDDESHAVPDWEDLVAGLARQLKVYDRAVASNTSELYISHALIVRALNDMTAAQRMAFFDHQVEFDSVMRHGAPPDKRLVGVGRSVAALGLVNAAGFTLYTASSTALGLVTHAVGITLPFAAYIGLSSTIAFLIGPAGWLAVSAYAIYKVTSTDWARLAPAIVYLINARAAKGLKPPDSSTPFSD